MRVGEKFAGWHSKKKVITRYCRDYSMSNPKVQISYTHESKKNLKKRLTFLYRDYQFCVANDGRMVQSMYIDAYEAYYSDGIDYEYLIEQLEKAYVSDKFTRKEKKGFIKIIKMFKKKKEDMDRFFPTIRDLEIANHNLEMAKAHMYD